MNRLLMIVYHFHPDFEVGAMRSVKFAKFLPASGWEPRVVTVREQYYKRIDPTPLPFECVIYRTAKWPILNDCYLWVKSKLARTRKSQTPAKLLQSQAEVTTGFGNEGAPLWRRFIDSLSWTPDYHVGWLWPGVWSAFRVVKRDRIDVIYTSGPPQTGHVIGLIVKLLTRSKWVADFRDPWTSGEKMAGVSTAMSKWIERWLEAQVMRRADLVLTTSEELRQVLARLHGPCLEAKCRALVNGYDEEDFTGRRQPASSTGGPIRFVYAGTLYMGRDPSALFGAFGDLVKERFVDRQDLRIEFFGSIDIGMAGLQQVVSEQGLEGVVQFLPSVKREAYLDLICGADALLLMQSAMAPTQIPAKTFEYLASGNRILAIVPDGATSNILAGFGGVWTAHPENREEIKQALKGLMADIRTAGRNSMPNRAGIEQLTKRRLTERFASLLNPLTSE